MAVNPELIVANDISRLLLFPVASKIETFVKGRVELIEFTVSEDNRLVGMSLAAIYKKFQIKILVCAVEHEGKVFIPDGEYVLQAGDKLHITGAHEAMEAFFQNAWKTSASDKDQESSYLRRRPGAYYLAARLCKIGMHVKIIEKDEIGVKNYAIVFRSNSDPRRCDRS